MSKLKRLIVGIVSAAVLLVGMRGVAEGSNDIEYYYTPIMTAGTWWSGYNSQIVSVGSSWYELYGGDVGVTFVKSSVGLPSTFYRTITRMATVELKEDDPGTNENELVATYSGRFSADPYTGLYQVPSMQRQSVNSSCIESNGTAELYIRVLVDINSNDESRNIPKQLFKYYFWSNN